MIHINKIKIFTVMACLSCALGLQAVSKEKEKLIRLEADMLKYISTNDRDTFIKITDQLKDVSYEAGEERLYYTAWSNQAIYEATHQFYQRAFEIADNIMVAARKFDSKFGQYMAMHTRATILLQKQDYDAAENAYLEATEMRHRFFPDESAGEDLQELMKIANHRKDGPAGEKYARLILAEPNPAPIHKGRALYRLSQMAFNKNNVAEFNRIYKEMMELKRTDGIGTIEPIVEVNYHIMNGEFDEALKLSEQLEPVTRAERQAVIYHRMGDDTKAFSSMQQFKKISDSITLVSHGNVVASCYVQMNNERMRLEQSLLEQRNNQLRIRLYISIGASIIIILLILGYQRQKAVRILKRDNKKLEKEKKDAEKALDVKNEFLNNITKELRTPLNPITGFTDILGTSDYQLEPEEQEAMRQLIKENSRLLSHMIDEMAEFSFFESKSSIPLSTNMNPHVLCEHLVSAMEIRCHPGVKLTYQSKLPQDYTIQSNVDALEKLLTHLLENAVHFTHIGSITVICELIEKNVRFSVADTGPGIIKSNQNQVFDMLSDSDNDARSIGMTYTICKSIARLLHGHIWLDEEYMNGVRFCFELPQEVKLK